MLDRDKLIVQIRESQVYLKSLSDKYDNLADAAINSKNHWYTSSVAYIGISIMHQINRTAITLINALSQESPPPKETKLENE